jgi:hypothetical protein
VQNAGRERKQVGKQLATASKEKGDASVQAKGSLKATCETRVTRYFFSLLLSLLAVRVRQVQDCFCCLIGFPFLVAFCLHPFLNPNAVLGHVKNVTLACHAWCRWAKDIRLQVFIFLVFSSLLYY